jgi:hypothetical protein
VVTRSGTTPMGMGGFKAFDAAERFCRGYDELRAFLRLRSHHRQHVSANRRRLLQLRRASTVLAILRGAEADSTFQIAPPLVARKLNEPLKGSSKPRPTSSRTTNMKPMMSEPGAVARSVSNATQDSERKHSRVIIIDQKQQSC